MHPLRAFLEEIGRRLQSPEMAARVQGDWDDPLSRPVVRIAPPATPAQIADLEAQISQPLPRGLREVLAEVSAEVEIAWVLRGRQARDHTGLCRVEITTDVPDDLKEWDRGLLPDGKPRAGAKRVELVTSGALRFSLAWVIDAARQLPDWMTIVGPSWARDPVRAEHDRFIRDFMAAGLPVMMAPNHDWLAVDLRDPQGCMMHVSHEGDDEAGIEIDLGLPQFLAQLAALGPAWPDFREILLFSSSVGQLVEGDPRVTAVRFDGASPFALRWSDWFWGGDPPVLPTALTGRCGGPVG